jgi:hypothetical protein
MAIGYGNLPMAIEDHTSFKIKFGNVDILIYLLRKSYLILFIMLKSPYGGTPCCTLGIA